MDQTPLSLLDRLRRRPDDQPSWRRLTALYTPWIGRWLTRQGLPRADADDLTQEILLVLVRELPGFDHNGRPGAFRHWVRTITANRLRGYWRSRRREAGDGSGALDGLCDPESELSRAWDREHDVYVARRLLELVEPEFAPSTWRGFYGQVIEGRPAAAVADDLGVTVNAVLIAKSRVLRRLRQEGAGLID